MSESIIIHIMDATLSLAQMNIQLAQPERNLERAEVFIKEAASRRSRLILLPELWSTGYDLANGHEHSRANLMVLSRLKELAQQLEIDIGGSLLLEDAAGRVCNTFVLLPCRAENPVMYRKIHLFRLMSEDQWLHPGEEMVQWQADWGSTGLGICYDLRFPEMWRRYALNGVQIALLPAEWPLVRVEHWKILLRARAIENQMFFAAVNAVGSTGGETFGGSSGVFSPWGEAVVEAGSTGEALLTAAVDLSEVTRVRAHIPIFADRRPEIYGG